ncbi:MAG: aldolase/citrate lyase family protein [Acidimicrobiales bacterium]
MSAPAPFKDRLQGDRPQIGMWVATGSSYCAEICAGSGLDWLLIDSEHAPNDLRSLLVQLQVVEGYPICPVVRPPVGDAVLLKQLLDIGVRSLLIPMVDSPEQADAVVQAVRYPPRGIRGVGSALGRASRWNRDAGYLSGADDGITVLVQVESVRALRALEDIVGVDGVDGVFIGPSDLAASLGHLGRQDHPDVVAAVSEAVQTVTRLGKPAGVNAFSEPMARRYLAEGCRFVLVGADVTLLARGSEALAATYIGASTGA